METWEDRTPSLKTCLVSLATFTAYAALEYYSASLFFEAKTINSCSYQILRMIGAASVGFAVKYIDEVFQNGERDERVCSAIDQGSAVTTCSTNRTRRDQLIAAGYCENKKCGCEETGSDKRKDCRAA